MGHGCDSRSRFVAYLKSPGELGPVQLSPSPPTWSVCLSASHIRSILCPSPGTLAALRVSILALFLLLVRIILTHQCPMCVMMDIRLAFRRGLSGSMSGLRNSTRPCIALGRSFPLAPYPSWGLQVEEGLPSSVTTPGSVPPTFRPRAACSSPSTGKPPG